MASFINLAAPILQITGGTVQLADHINELLGADDLERLRIAVSYVRWSGLGILATGIEGFFKKHPAISQFVTQPRIRLWGPTKPKIDIHAAGKQKSEIQGTPSGLSLSE